jgi:hypothetical protein
MYISTWKKKQTTKWNGKLVYKTYWCLELNGIKKRFLNCFLEFQLILYYIYTGIMEEIFIPTQRADNRESTYLSDITEELS